MTSLSATWLGVTDPRLVPTRTASENAQPNDPDGREESNLQSDRRKNLMIGVVFDHVYTRLGSSLFTQ
jgi:hypothetical protein